ncbi:MAG: glycosyl hydrolase family 28 protein, partial [Armatimonadota bacterium]
ITNGNTYNHLLEGEFYVPIISQAPVLIMGSQDIMIEALCVRNARIFNYTIFDCDRVTLRNCKALTPAASTPESTDSIDIDASDSVIIDNMLAFGNDDCFAWGNPSGDSTFWGAPAGSYLYYPFHEQAMSRDISRCVIHGMVGWNPRANAVRFGCIGGSSPVGVDDILFENCDFAGIACSGVFIGSLKDSPSISNSPRYSSIRFVDCGFDTAQTTMGFVMAPKAQIDLLEFENVVLSHDTVGTVIDGPDNNKSGEIVFRNVSIGGSRMTDAEEANFEIRNFGDVTVE